MRSTRLCLSRWVVLLCHLFALSNFSKLTNFEAIPDPKRLEVSTSQFYLKLFRESQRFQWYHLCRAWWSGLDPSPRRQSWFQLKGISWEFWKNFKQLMILMCLARHSPDKCLEQNDISSDESWHHHGIIVTLPWHFHDMHLFMSSRLSIFVKIDVRSWPTFGYQGPWCRSAWDFGNR